MYWCVLWTTNLIVICEMCFWTILVIRTSCMVRPRRCKWSCYLFVGLVLCTEHQYGHPQWWCYIKVWCLFADEYLSNSTSEEDEGAALSKPCTSSNVRVLLPSVNLSESDIDDIDDHASWRRRTASTIDEDGQPSPAEEDGQPPPAWGDRQPSPDGDG